MNQAHTIFTLYLSGIVIADYYWKKNGALLRLVDLVVNLPKGSELDGFPRQPSVIMD